MVGQRNRQSGQIRIKCGKISAQVLFSVPLCTCGSQGRLDALGPVGYVCDDTGRFCSDRQPFPRIIFPVHSVSIAVCMPPTTNPLNPLAVVSGVHPDLASCINRVFVRGCEVEYLQSVADQDLFTCSLANPNRRLQHHPKVVQKIRPRDLGEKVANTEPLVVHVRSGDVFTLGTNSKYGQVTNVLRRSRRGRITSV